MRIAVLAGGDSSEYKISVKSGVEIQKWLDLAGYNSDLVIMKGSDWNVKIGSEKIPIDKNIFAYKKGGKLIKFDYAWNMIHGTPGENGRIQGYLDILNIPYSSSNLLSSALTFNKFTAKSFLKQFKIQTAEAELIRSDKDFDINEIIEKVGLPCFVKPNNGGSSFGTTKVNHAENMAAAIEDAFREDKEVIVESFLKGREVTCGVVKTSKESITFPVTEIISKNDFFDYEAKYEGKSEEITPANIDEDIAKKCQLLSSEIYDHVNCKGIIRVDFILKGNQLYFLELNTIPGMSKESIVPQQIRANNMKVEDVLKLLIEDSLA